MSVNTAAIGERAPRGPSLTVHVLAILGYFALALLVTYPAVSNFTIGVPGDLIADRNQNLWNLWWIKESLFRGVNPFQTDMLFYPYGASLYYHTLGLPQGLIGLLPQLLWGLPAAYNTVLLVAFTLSGYGAFRLALLYTTQSPKSKVQSPKPESLNEQEEHDQGSKIQNPKLALERSEGSEILWPTFLGGVVFAFTPYTLDALKGQLEVLSVQWMPFYAEAWLRTWSPTRATDGAWAKYASPVLAGVFFALTAYTSLYYALYLLVFTLAHLLYMGIGRRESGTESNNRRFPIPVSRFLIIPIVAGVLMAPLIMGLAFNHNNPRLEVRADPAHTLAHSADLLSFFAPPHDHPLLPNVPQKPGVEEPAIHDYLSLGYVAFALSLLGAWVRRRDRDVLFWTLLGFAALVLSMGPQLQIGRNLTGFPMPFKLVEGLPGVDAIAKPERFVVLVRLCMSVLAACGVAWLMRSFKFQVSSFKFQIARFTFHVSRFTFWVGILLLALLLVELPIHPRYMEPLPESTAWTALADARQAGALMELPFATQQVGEVSERMLAQTAHGRPIMSGYLSRNYNSPIIDSCSPFWGFISPLDVPKEGQEIASPLVVSRLADVLNLYDIRYIALDSKYAGPDSGKLDPKEQAAFIDIISQVADETPLYRDEDVATYRVLERDVKESEPSFHIGNGWYKADDSGGKPFRWLEDQEAALCVFVPRHPVRASLVMEGTAFGKERDVQLLAGDKTLYTGTLPDSGRFASIRTEPIDWPVGVTEVRVISGEPGTTPKSLDPSTPDERPLSVGFQAVRLETTPQK